MSRREPSRRADAPSSFITQMPGPPRRTAHERGVRAPEGDRTGRARTPRRPDLSPPCFPRVTGAARSWQARPSAGDDAGTTRSHRRERPDDPACAGNGAASAGPHHARRRPVRAVPHGAGAGLALRAFGRRLGARARGVAREHPAALDDARRDPGRAGRPRAARARRGRPAAGPRGDRRRGGAGRGRGPAARRRRRHRRRAGPRVLRSTSSSRTSPSSCTAPASCARCARPTRGRCAPSCGACADEADQDEVADVLSRAQLRPVFTAHPTESSRQSVLAILRRVVDALDTGATDRQLGALVDLLWQTDEIRPGRPTVADEARNIAWFAERLGERTVPDLLDEFAAEAADAGLTVPDDARPLVLGSWVGGDRDGNPNVTPAVTREVLELYADRALRIHGRLVEQLVTELSVSTRVMGVSEELRGSLARDRRALPERLRPVHPAQRARAVPAQALLRPGTPGAHPPPDRRARPRTWRTRTTSGVQGYLDDLGVLDRSLRAHLGDRIADGTLARAIRAARDARAAPGRARHPRAQREAPRRPRRDLRRARRAGQAVRRADPRGAHASCWPHELQRAAPAGPPPLRAAGRAATDVLATFDMLHEVQHEFGTEVLQHLHRLDVPGRRRPARRHRAGPRVVHGRAQPEPAVVGRPRAAVRDRRGAVAGRRAARRAAVGAGLPPAGAQPR